MPDIKKRHFRILADFPAVREFMLRVYQRNWHNGVPAPFLEYALSADWADQTLAHRDAIWEDDGRIVGFCFYESHPGRAFFNLDPEYPGIAGDMIDHAIEKLADTEGKLRVSLFEGQDALINAACERGFKLTDSYIDNEFNLKNPLDYPLPEGYRFVDPRSADVGKILLCCWKGFNHEAEGEWDGNVDVGLRTALAPNATPEYAVEIEHIATGEYVCYSGMWWTAQNKLAYMEPLCTVPMHRKKGLAAAALSEMARRMRPLGAEWMTGGANAFYPAIGYEPAVCWLSYTKE